MNKSGSISKLVLLAAIAVLADAAAAKAGCIPSVEGTGSGNVCIGPRALENNDTGGQNTAVGGFALNQNTAGSNNAALGIAALVGNTLGGDNTAMGANSLSTNSSGSFNTAYGSGSLINSSKGSLNTAVGYQSGGWAAGSNNVALGAGAGQNQIQGSYNIVIGTPGAFDDKNTIRIGSKNKHTSAFIAGIRGVNVTAGQAVVINASGQLGVSSSSVRYDRDIQPMGSASDALMQLHPVTFRYKQAEKDGSRPLQYGLIAEDVAKIMPALAVYNEDGAPEGVAYQLLPSFLLNEYQKQNAKLASAEAKLDAAERKLAASEDRLAAVEAQMAAIQETLSQVAAAAGGKLRVASARQ